jgi:hypothetical protein
VGRVENSVLVLIQRTGRVIGSALDQTLEDELTTKVIGFDVSILSIINIAITTISAPLASGSLAEVRKLCEGALLTIEQAAGHRDRLPL